MSMRDLFSKFSGTEEEGEDYIEVDLGKEEDKSKVKVKPFVLKKFDDVNNILNHLREGYTIAVIDIADLKKKDVIELKRAVSKIKKTAEALEGDISGFGENIVLVTPSFAQIHRESDVPQTQPDSQQQTTL